MEFGNYSNQGLNFKDLKLLFAMGQPRIYILGFALKYNLWGLRGYEPSTVLVKQKNRFTESQPLVRINYENTVKIIFIIPNFI